MEITGIQSSEIDKVAIAGLSGDLLRSIYKINTVFSVKDWISQCYKIWKPVLLQNKKFDPFKDFNTFSHLNINLKKDKYYPLVERLRNTSLDQWSHVAMEERKKIISNHIKIDPNKIKFYRHEDCHKVYGYYSSQNKHNKSLIFTLEGGGDDSSATVSTFINGTIEEKWSSNEVMLGRLYRYVTLILGMLPVQHEYKVMGLAPYGSEYHGKKKFRFFSYNQYCSRDSYS